MENIKEIVEECFGEVASEIEQECDRVIESTSEFASEGFPSQDIIDTGRLLDSKEVNASDTSLQISWNPRDPNTGFPYASAIVNGFFAYGGSKYIPGRNFPVRAVQNSDPVDSLVKKLKAKGLKARVKANTVKLV